MILSIAWAVLVVAGLVSVAAIPPARSLRTTSGASASIRVGPWRLRRRDVALGSLAIAASALVIGPVLTAGLAAVAMLARWWSSRRRIAADLAAREEVVPELVELVAVALRAGASPASAVDRVAVLTAGLPAEPIHRAAAQIRSGLPATEAWSALRGDLTDVVRGARHRAERPDERRRTFGRVQAQENGAGGDAAHLEAARLRVDADGPAPAQIRPPQPDVTAVGRSSGGDGDATEDHGLRREADLDHALS